MKLRKSRLLVLGAIAILAKMVKEERIKYLKGDTTSGRFKWNDSPDLSVPINQHEEEMFGTFKGETSKIDALGNEVRIISTDYLKEVENLVASPGMDFVRVRISFTGGTKEDVTVSSDDFFLESENGKERKYEEGTFLGKQLVKKGEKVEGSLLFEVPENIKNLTLVFSVGNILGETKIRIK